MAADLVRGVSVVDATASATPLRAISRTLLFQPQPPQGQQRRGMAAGVARERTTVTRRLWEARLEAARAAGVADKEAGAQPQSQLVPKPPIRTSIRYNFERDEDLKEAYRNPWNGVRIGRIVEDLDSLAGNIAFQHCDDADRNTRPQLLVTASVDRVRLLRPLVLSEDMVLSGAVAWVGRSSMVIRMEAWPADHPQAPRDYIGESGGGGGGGRGKEATPTTDELKRKYEAGPSLSADFTFVARDAITNRGAAVNPLVPGTEAERALFEATEARVAAKKKRMKVRAAGDAGLSESLVKAKAAFVDELSRASRALHELPALAPSDVITTEETRTENIFVAQPQQRNLSGRIFGGFLLRRAFELAFATAYVFGGARPFFKQVSDMDFLRPVDIGDLMRFRARVLYAKASETGRPCVDVEVEALVTKPEAVTTEVSNTFMFKFYVGGGVPGAVDGVVAKPPKRVLPKSREEAAHIWERCERPRLQAELEDEEAPGGGV